MYMSPRAKIIGLVILKIVLSIFIIIGTFMSCVAVSFSLRWNLDSVIWAILICGFTALVFVWFGRVKWLRRTMVVVCAVVLSIGTGQYVQKLYHESLKVKDVNINVEEYLPYDSGSKIAVLSEGSTLRLTENLPRVDGAAALFPVYSAFVNAVYPKAACILNEEYGVDAPFNYLNTVMGYKSLAEKRTDIFFGASPSERQIQYGKEQGTEFVYTPIGREAFVFFVNADSDVTSLTSEQIRRIYSGEITDWSEVGYHKGPIVAYQRNPGSGSQTMFEKFMSADSRFMLMSPPNEEIVDTMMGITNVVATYVNDNSAIGFSFRYYLDTLVNNPKIKMIAVDGVEPTVENIANGTYPIASEFYAVTRADDTNPNTQLFLDWILGPQGQELIEKTGYVPIS